MRQVPDDDPDDPVFSYFLGHTHTAAHADDEPALATQMSFTTGAMRGHNRKIVDLRVFERLRERV